METEEERERKKRKGKKMTEERNHKGREKKLESGHCLNSQSCRKKSGIIREGKNCSECSEFVCPAFSFNTEEDQKIKIRKM